MLMGCARCYQIECCICEWLNGIYKESAWTEKHYITNYFAHLNSLHDLDAHGANREGRDILAQIRDDLLKNARSVSSSSVINSLR